MKVPFSKYSGSGNDFILIDNRLNLCPPDSLLMQRLCQRRTGIGADGVLLLENSYSADFKVKIFNADGSEPEMCGNGMRCFFKFLQSLGCAAPEYRIETPCSTVTLTQRNGIPCVAMPRPEGLEWDIPLKVGEETFLVHFINTGVPHCVYPVTHLEESRWMTLAPWFRNHVQFAPKGANVNFIHLDAQQRLHIRTYERGVEGETLACGTGATAAALIASHLYHLSSPIQVIPRSLETLEIHFTEDFDQVTLAGPAHLIFQGEWIFD